MPLSGTQLGISLFLPSGFILCSFPLVFSNLFPLQSNTPLF